ncbi:MAG: polysaccharide biosynthesis/export family protein [Bacteroidaceae bacterium]|nr:polysaccharide biosynthesis/export family protein [Bacteroidaceae bacterium]MCF0193586.1 polysaccharide biosynthesis/export family protein [Bacteroidaceae bacterium]
MNIKRLIPTIAIAAMLAACGTPKDIAYFQDSDQYNDIVVKAHEITVKRGDKLSIIINSKDPALASMFNMPIVTYRVGSTQQASTLGSSSQQMALYCVDSNGDIDFPVIGKIKVVDKSREEIANIVKERLVSEELIKDPVVTVEFENLYFSVLGEVKNPGRFDIKHDRVTLLDAISMAGDLTINGMRHNVTVLREEGDHHKLYKVDLTSANDLYNSPVFYLQQKDIVYAEPNDARKRQATVNGNNVRSTSFWISVASLLTSVAILVTNAVK